MSEGKGAMRRRFIASSSLIVAGMLAAPPMVQAQTAGAAANEQSDTSLDDIIVTAQKREQSINTVGMSIAAATGEELERRGIKDTADLGRLVPGFVFNHTTAGTPVYTLRGIGLNEYTLSAAPSVAVYIDQAPLPYPTMTTGAGLDIQRIEVLKGPQGTLFGQSSTGGAVNYIPNRPTDSFEAGLDLGLDNYGQVDARGFVSGPLAPTVNARLAISALEGGAWQHNTAQPGQKLGDARIVTGRAIVDWKPTDRLTFGLMATAQRDHSDTHAPQFVENVLNIYGSPAQAAAAGAAPISQNPFAVVDPVRFAALTTPGSPAYDASFVRHQATVYARAAAGEPNALAYLGTQNPGKDAKKATWTPSLPMNKRDSFYQVVLRGDLEFSDIFKATSLFTYAKKKLAEYYDDDATAAAGLDNKLTGDIDFYSGELRFAVDTSRFHGVVGFDYARTDVEDARDLFFYDNSLSPIIPGLRFTTAQGKQTQTVDEYAAFAHGEFELIDRLNLTLGIRYNKADRTAYNCGNDPASDTAQNVSKTFTILGRGTPIAPGQCYVLNNTVPFSSPLFGRPTVTPFVVTLNEENVPWNVGLDYKTQQGTLLYALVSKGYKAGLAGNNIPTVTSQYLPTKQEELLAYEAGFKAPLFNRHVHLNASAFYYDYSDKQVRVQVADPNFGSLERVVNVPKSRAYGFEAELAAKPIKNLSLSLAASYLNTKVTSDFFASNQAGYFGNFKGSKLPYAPQWTVLANADYEFPFNDKFDGFVGGGVTYHSKTLQSFISGPLVAPGFVDAAHMLVDLRAGIASPDGGWRLSLYCKNCTDTFYQTSIGHGIDTVFRVVGHPVTVGINLSLRTR